MGEGIASPKSGSPEPPATAQLDASAEYSRGLLYGLIAYGSWGAFPLLFSFASAASPWEVLVHRVLWSLVACLAVAAALRQKVSLGLLKSPRTLALSMVASLLIAGNWTLYVYGVFTDRVVETSLGYFINPLVSIAIGVAVYRERLRPLQWGAVALGAVAVAVLSIQAGHVPWIAIGLALLFASYGVAKKHVGLRLSALEGLITETLVLLPVVGALWWVLAARNMTVFGSDDVGTTVMLVVMGVLTAFPLLAFAAAAKRLPLSMMGMMQFLAPTLQFILGVLYFREEMSPARWAGFVLVWLALTLLSIDMFRNRRIK